MKQVNIKDEWYDVPEEARYVAQDDDGEWWWYTLTPSVDLEWVPHEKEEYEGFNLIFRADSPKDYTQELYELKD